MSGTNDTATAGEGAGGTPSPERAAAAADSTSSSTQATSPEEARIAELVSMAHSPDKAKAEAYADPAVQAELTALMEAKVARGQDSSDKPADTDKLTFSPDELALIKAEEGETDEDTQEEAEPKEKALDLPDADVVPKAAADYVIPAPPTGERSEIDDKLIASASERFLKAGLNKGQVAAVIEAYDAAQAEAAQLYDDMAAARQAENVAEIRKAFGDNYDAEVKLANDWLIAQLDEVVPGGAQAFVSLQLPDGSYLGDLPNFVLWANKQARLAGAGNTGELGASPSRFETDSEARERRIAEITSLAHKEGPTAEREYKRLLPELHRLVAGRSGKAVPAAPAQNAVGAMSAEARERRIGQILALAHTGKIADEEKYKQLRPELERLIAARTRK